MNMKKNKDHVTQLSLAETFETFKQNLQVWRSDPHKGRLIPETLKQEVVRLYQAGISIANLQTLGLSYIQIKSWLHKYGVAETVTNIGQISFAQARFHITDKANEFKSTAYLERIKPAKADTQSPTKIIMNFFHQQSRLEIICDQESMAQSLLKTFLEGAYVATHTTS